MTIRVLSIVLSLLMCSLLAGQDISEGAWEVRERTATGMRVRGAVLNNGQVLGKSGGVPVAVTPFTQTTADALYPSLAGAYANPAWLTSLAWSKLASTPTTLAGYGISDALTAALAASTYEPIISAGTTAQYWRGDKSWQALNATAVGLGNVSNALQLVAANNLSDLTSAATARANLGLGAAALLATSTGGNGTSDAGKALTFGSFGETSVSRSLTITRLNSGGWLPGILQLKAADDVTAILVPSDGMGSFQTFTLPTVGGTLIGTGNLSAITATGTITSGTWNGTAIGLGYLAQGGATSGQVLSWNGSTWAPAAGGGGLTVGTTTTSGAASGDILTSNGTTLQRLAPGSGVSAWLATPSLANFNAALSDADVATTGANTFSGAQAVSFAIAAATQANGLQLVNSTAATNGNQTWSPSLRLTGNQWASSASRTCEFLMTVVPVQQNYDHAILRFATKHGTDALTTLLDVRNLNGAPYIERGGNITIGSSGANGALLLQYNGTVYAALASSSGAGSFVVATDTITIGSGGYYGGNSDLHLTREAAAIQQNGVDTNGDAVDQTIKAADGITGTDRSGADYTIASGRGTGAGAVSSVIIATPAALSTGTTAQTNTERMRVNSSGVTIGSGGSAIGSVKRASVTLVAGTATVSDTATTANSVVIMSRLTPGGTLGDLDYDVSAGASYTINSSSATETSVINIIVIHFP